MLRSITAKQFLEWMAYARMEPFNELRDDQRAASIVQMVFNMAGKMAKDSKPLSDFMLKWDPEEAKPKKQTWQEQSKMLNIVALMYSVPAVEG